MLNASVLARICEAAEWIYLQNSTMRNIFIAELVSSIIAILTISITLLAILFNKTLHFNVRLLLICFCGSFAVSSIGTVLDSTYYLVAIIVKAESERCAFLTFTKSDCIALRNVYYLGSTVLVVSTLFLSIERVIATLLYRTYERNPRKWIGIIMAILQWLLIVPLVCYQDQDNGYIFPYCAYELFNPRTIGNIEFALIVIQFCSFAIIVVLWTHNNKKFLCKKYQHENVSVRYQLRENVSTTKLMMPIVVIVTVLVLSGAFLYIILLPSRKTNDYWVVIDHLLTYCLYAELQACVMPVSAIILAVILCYTSQAIRRSLFHLLGLEYCFAGGCRNSVETSPDEFIRRTYFDQLQRQWSNLPSNWKSTTYNCAECKGSQDIKSSKYQYMD